MGSAVGLRLTLMYLPTIAPVNAIAWCAAELLRDGKLAKSSDVYSFGMIMWELYSGRHLFENHVTGQVGALPCCAVPSLTLPPPNGFTG